MQAKCGIVILAFGISNVVSTNGYKIAGFMIFAPLLFLSPLLLFTKQLSRTKKRTFTQLTGSAAGPMIPLPPYLVKLPEPWQQILEALTKWLPH